MTAIAARFCEDYNYTEAIQNVQGCNFLSNVNLSIDSPF